jgi:hypothetical protein
MKDIKTRPQGLLVIAKEKMSAFPQKMKPSTLYSWVQRMTLELESGVLSF